MTFLSRDLASRGGESKWTRVLSRALAKVRFTVSPLGSGTYLVSPACSAKGMIPQCRRQQARPVSDKTGQYTGPLVWSEIQHRGEHGGLWYCPATPPAKTVKRVRLITTFEEGVVDQCPSSRSKYAGVRFLPALLTPIRTLQKPFRRARGRASKTTCKDALPPSRL